MPRIRNVDIRSAAACLAISVGCAGKIASDRNSVTSRAPATGSGQDAGTGTGVGFVGDDASSSFAVDVSPPDPVICAGQCVTLTAQATATEGALAFMWDDGSAGAARRVCPVTTSRYTVVATSAGGGGEFPTPNQGAEATATVTVSASCGDAGAPGLPRSDAGAPTGPAQALCSLAWPMTSMYGVLSTAGMRTAQGAVTADVDGNIVVVGGYNRTATIGGQMFSALGGPSGNYDALVVKLSPQCQLMWAKDFGGLDANMGILAVKTDPASNIVLAGSLSGSVNLGTGPIETNSNGAALVLKLDPNGNPLWAESFGSQSMQNVVLDLAVDATGSPIVVTEAGPDTDFGAGAVGGNSISGSFLVKLNPDGSLAFAKASAALAPEDWGLYTVDTRRDGSIWLSGKGSLNASVDTMRIALVSPTGAPVETRVVTTASQMMPNPMAAVRVGPYDDVVLSSGFVTTNATTSAPVPWSRWVQELAQSDAPLWATATVMPGDESVELSPAITVGVNAEGDVLVGGQFEGMLGGPGGGAVSAGGSDVYVALLNATGVEQSVARWGGPDSESLFDMAVGPDGSAILTGTIGSSTTSMYVVRLGW
jgi:hypothetical protein